MNPAEVIMREVERHRASKFSNFLLKALVKTASIGGEDEVGCDYENWMGEGEAGEEEGVVINLTKH